MNYWLLAVTFLSVNLDFFFMLLFLLKRYRVGAVMLGYLLGTTLLFIGVLSVAIVWLIHLIADIPVVTQVMDRYGERLMKVCYILIGVYVFWDSGLIAHVLSWF